MRGDYIRKSSKVVSLVMSFVIGLGIPVIPPKETEQLPANHAVEIRNISPLFESEFVAEEMAIFIPEEEDEDDDTEPPPDVVEEPPNDVQSKENRIINVEATYYTADCEGCIGITKSGVDVSNTIYYDSKRIIAVDPGVIPLGTSVIVRTDNGEEFEATAQDTGSAIQGNRIDILVETESEAFRLGRVVAEVEIIQ